MLNALYNFQYCFPCSCMLNEHFFVNAEIFCHYRGRRRQFVYLTTISFLCFVLFFSIFEYALCIFDCGHFEENKVFCVSMMHTAPRTLFARNYIWFIVFVGFYILFSICSSFSLFSFCLYFIVCCFWLLCCSFFDDIFCFVYILLLFIFLRRVKFRINVNLVFV